MRKQSLGSEAVVIGSDEAPVSGTTSSAGVRTRELVRNLQSLSYPVALAAQLREGATLNGKWRLDSVLGVGGMAAVYAATHRNGHRVAIKVLHSTLAWDASTLRRFKREGYTANSIRHPGVVRVLDDDETRDGNVFIVMDLLEGETLSTRLTREGPVSEATAVRIGISVLDVLSAAHDVQVVHRDIKPENIFLTKSNEVKVLDFGIARLKQATQDVTQTGAILGSPAYMAPEQASGRTDAVDAQTDVWALGATLFHMLTGRYVHDNTDLPRKTRARLRYVATTPAPALKSIRPDVSDELAAIVDRALAFNKADRFPDAQSMLAALQALTPADSLLDGANDRLCDPAPSSTRRALRASSQCQTSDAPQSCQSGKSSEVKCLERGWDLLRG